MKIKTKKNNNITKKSKKINLINLIEFKIEANKPNDLNSTNQESNLLKKNIYRPTFSIDNNIVVSNTKILVEMMLVNNWIMKEFKPNRITDWCNNTYYSKIKNKDHSRFNHWANKFQLFVILKDQDFIPSTYPIYNGKWILNEPKEDSLFFIKSPSGSRGKNIVIVKTKKDVIDISNNRSKLLVIQKGIDCLLYEKKKFDIRIWASLITSNFIEFDLIFYNYGKIRLSTKEYDSDSLKIGTHLTNTYLHKNNENYKELFFDESFPDYENKFKCIKEVIKKTFEKSKDLFINLKNNNKKLVWNLGFDFIFDKNNKCYLLEINGLDVAAYNNKHIDDWYLFLVSNVYNSFAGGSKPTLNHPNVSII